MKVSFCLFEAKLKCYNFFMELTSLKGIGEARKKSFEENDIFSVEDLVNYFPYKYYDFSKTEPFAEDGCVRLIKAMAIDSPKLVRARANLTFVSVKMQDEIGHTFTAMWFNQAYIKQQIYLGKEVYLYGKNSKTKKNTFIVSIYKSLEKLELGLLPVYHSVSGIGQGTLTETIYNAIETLDFTSIVPDKLLQKYNLMNLKEAYKEIHKPMGFVMATVASHRIEIEKLIPLLAINEYNKFQRKKIKNHTYTNSTKILEDYKKLLPFSLTEDQRNVLSEVEKDLASKFSMNRMVQGDVGSGKTVVSLFGAYLSAKNGHQAVIIAPTEILANQHFETAIQLFFKDKVSICKLTSSVKGIERQIALKRIASGEAKIIVGTHSILSDEVSFADLTYAVIDEQHRFGVEQRAKLLEKGNSPDILVMSATPIPRTLALVVYGSLEISTINSRPKQNNITTNIVLPIKQDAMWEYIKDKIDTGSKAYVVCAKIDEENESDHVNLFSAKNMYEYLLTKFNKLDLGLVHGKLSKDSQNKVIEKFKKGTIKILVSTTIVEVGVDIPDCDIMVICTPERFGLATLHQLRGRIGRNGAEAHCFCLGNNLNENSYERINFFKNHSNGFDIADFDLDTRGSGNIMGTEQHGFSSNILANFSNKAFQTANELLSIIKHDNTAFAKVLEEGVKQSSTIDYDKIVLN